MKPKKLAGDAEERPRASGSTLANLHIAFHDAADAAARFAEFARAADGESFHKLAALFRAGAHAELVRAGNHAAVIRKMGGTPDARISPPSYDSARRNLRAAINAAKVSHYLMYPLFLKAAENERHHDAVRTFEYAVVVETQYARLLALALANLDKMTTRAAYHVCPHCGYTVEKTEFQRCPVCRESTNQFKLIS